MAPASTADFDAYFRTQYPLLVSELDYILGDTDLARDVAQDAFIRQYVSWSQLSRYDKPGAWVRRVALRIAFKTRRRMFRTVPLESTPEQVAPGTNSERVMDVRQAILRLTKAQRAVVVLHYYRDLPVTEVAKIVGAKEATIKVHLFNARARLAQLLANYKPRTAE